jgi:hypothetical protein
MVRFKNSPGDNACYDNAVASLILNTPLLVKWCEELPKQKSLPVSRTIKIILYDIERKENNHLHDLQPLIDCVNRTYYKNLNIEELFVRT